MTQQAQHAGLAVAQAPALPLAGSLAVLAEVEQDGLLLAGPAFPQQSGGAGAAVGAVARRAARPGLRTQRRLQLRAQEAGLDAAVDVAPGQGRVDGQLSMDVEIGVHARLVEGPVPEVELQLVAPAVEAAAEPEGRLDGVPNIAVAARQHALQQRRLDVVELDADPLFAAHSLEDGSLLFGQLLSRRHRQPLERCVRLGHEVGDGGGHVDALLERRDRLRELGDAGDVVVGFSRQADHEVEFDQPPAQLEGHSRGVEYLLLAYALVDRVAQALSARLGRDREARLAHAGDQLEQFSIDARRAQ